MTLNHKIFFYIIGGTKNSTKTLAIFQISRGIGIVNREIKDYIKKKPFKVRMAYQSQWREFDG
jgi:hypothetical protein